MVAAARLARSLDNYLRVQSSNTGGNGSNNDGVQKSIGGDGGGDRRHGGPREGDGHEDEGDDFEFDGEAPSKNRDAAEPVAAPAAAVTLSACGEEDEAKVAAFARLLEAGSGEAEFLKETG